MASMATSATCPKSSWVWTSTTATSRRTRSSPRKKIMNELKDAPRGRRHLPRGRPRPRGRGDLLAPRRRRSARASKKKIQRVIFNEITKKAVLAAMENAGEIDEQKVDAQQARRIIDRLGGLRGSDHLWKKVCARPLGRPRPVGRAEDHLRARARDRGLRRRSSTGRSTRSSAPVRRRPSSRTC